MTYFPVVQGFGTASPADLEANSHLAQEVCWSEVAPILFRLRSRMLRQTAARIWRAGGRIGAFGNFLGATANYSSDGVFSNIPGKHSVPPLGLSLLRHKSPSQIDVRSITARRPVSKKGEYPLADLNFVSATKLAEMVRIREVSVTQIAEARLSLASMRLTLN